MNKELHRYIIVFFITASIFALVFVVSGYFSRNKIAELYDIQDQIALDILSTETRYSLLEKTSCEHIFTTENIEQELSQELTSLARKLKFLESESPTENADISSIKKQYSLLQIKDYLLMQEIQERCGQAMVSILYFHEGDCSDCRRQSLILDKLSDDYPQVRIYWLDKDVITQAMQTMLSLFNVTTGPSLVIDEVTHEGYISYEDLLLKLSDRLIIETEEDESEEGDKVEDKELEKKNSPAKN